MSAVCEFFEETVVLKGFYPNGETIASKYSKVVFLVLNGKITPLMLVLVLYSCCGFGADL
jgi:hypothetical protein